MVELSKVLRGVDFRTHRDISKVRIRGIAPHASLAKRGDLFIAVRGHACDGHRFVDEAIRRGARVVIAETGAAGAVRRMADAPRGREAAVRVFVDNTRDILPDIAANFYGHPSRALRTVGITGTNGKTTVTYLVESILKERGCGVGVIGTINYRIGKKTEESKNTTPGILELHAMLREMVDAHLEYAVMEVSSHALDQNRIAGVGLDCAAFTNITREHLDYHKTFDRYMNAKSKIFTFLKESGVAVLNADDPRVLGITRSIANPVITYGITRAASVMAADISIGLGGSAFTVTTEKGDIRIRTRLMGMHNVSNILAAVGIAMAEGIDPSYIKAGLERVRGVPGRLESVGVSSLRSHGSPRPPGSQRVLRSPFHVYVDYAHTDDALSNVLRLLRSAVRAGARDIITVFGCGGDRDKFKRPRMGRVACLLSDKVVITSDNPRSERPASIIADIVKGTKGRFSNYVIEEDRAAAIKKALLMAKEGDCVLIAGKGHEKHQIIGDRVIPFDDRKVVKDFLRRL